MRAISNGLLIVALVCAWTISAQAKGKHAARARSMSVTGCLQSAAQPNAYSLKAEDGKTYDLSSTSVKLADHVGHKVTITGTEEREKTSTSTSSSSSNSSSSTTSTTTNPERLNVTKLKMVSTSCQ